MSGDLLFPDAFPLKAHEDCYSHLREPRRDAPEERSRVRGAVHVAILDYCRARVGVVFHMEDLTAYVRERVPSAPDSAGRILRLLRQEGALRYELVSRSRSEYRVLGVRERTTA